MAYTLTFETSAMPDVVVTAIKREAAYWQELKTPVALQRRRILSVEMHGDARRFELYAVYRQRPPFGWVAVTGRVVSVSTGTRVIARVGLKRGLFGPITILAGLGLVGAGTDLASSLIPWMIALIFGLVHHAYNGAIQPGREEVADHLVERFALAMHSVNARAITRG